MTNEDSSILVNLATDTDPMHCCVVNHTDMTESLFDMHYEYELGIILEGSMNRITEGHEETLVTGQVWLTSMWECHGFKLVEVPCRVLIIHFLPQILQEIMIPGASRFDWSAPFAVSPDKRPGIQGDDSKGRILTLAGQIIDSKEKNSKPNMLAAHLAILQLLVLLQDDWEMTGDKKDVSVGAYSRINSALLLVFKSNVHIPVQEAARACAMNPSTFEKTFKKTMGISFAKFALRYRLKQAALQLINTTDPLKQIVEDWGFTDDSHFHKSFTRLYACTPGEYRKRSLKQNLPA